MMNFKQKSKELKENLSALYIAYKRTDTPIAAKLIIGATIGYALSPIDLIPDFIPILGYLDDVIIVSLLITLSIKLIPENIMHECKEQSKDLWKDGKPQKWIYSIPILLFWIIILGIIINKIFN
ncbi:YkvA family protein [Metaclostridioides mangenotii]|uniref:Uncharacterized membrane protein YkvA (DUF1232 family) n=1 Tax=Metaclostridioides mangenotii TaxID=1540 RepID=A0ABS4EBW5_9FIRM|nr:YkvA family protein [Clostridioides mangenotii]MBP1855437.1 uncharacterized membrane protein YkvA (DUF1232 family) [Clostridioides mangenotii]